MLFDIEETMTEIMQNKCCGTNPERGGMTEKRIKFDGTKNPYDEKSLRYAIYSVLDVEPKSIQQIYEEVYNKIPEKRYSVSALQAELLFMQMERNAEEKNGRFFRTSNAE
ncbi:MAG: hypothetical protein E7289_08380 [Lachnospiraceae bacterium]|nr:hypothetical protein [Lachnospiraceae bacterium]